MTKRSDESNSKVMAPLRVVDLDGGLIAALVDRRGEHAALVCGDGKNLTAARQLAHKAVAVEDIDLRAADVIGDGAPRPP